jgi:hypothetical protein
MYSAGLAAPGLVLQSACFNTLQQQHCMPDGLGIPSLALPFNNSTAQALVPVQCSAGQVQDSLGVCCAGSAPLPGGSNSLLAALQGSSSASLTGSRPLTHQRVVGNGLAAAAAAADKLAQLQQLEMLQQQLRDDVVNLLPLI